MKQLETLLKELETEGCRVDQADGGIYLTLPDGYAEFVCEQEEMDDRIYLGTTFLAPEDFAHSEHTASLDRLLLELQDRNLGCHFSYDRAGYLSIGTIIHPPQFVATEILMVMEQIAFIAEVCIPICDQVLANGELPSDREIDQAFGLNEHLH